MDLLYLIIITLVLLAPGVIFLRIYYTREVTTSRTGTFDPSYIFISKAFIVTAFIHLISVLLFTDLSIIPFGLHFNWFNLRDLYDAMTKIISYSYGMEEVNSNYVEKHQEAWNSFFKHDKQIFYYNSFVSLITWFLALLARKIVIKTKFDLNHPLLRYPNPYFYLLTGQTPFLKDNNLPNGLEFDKAFDFIEVTCTMKNDKEYSGFLGHFVLSMKGWENLTIYIPVELLEGKLEELDSDYLLLLRENVLSIQVKHMKMIV